MGYNPLVFKPWRVLALFILLIGVANLVRVGATLFVAPVLEGWILSVPLPLLCGFYAFWGTLFVLVAIISWRRRGISWAVALGAGYQASLWLLRLTGYRSTYARSLWARDLILTVLFLAILALFQGREDSEEA